MVEESQTRVSSDGKASQEIFVSARHFNTSREGYFKIGKCVDQKEAKAVR